MKSIITTAIKALSITVLIGTTNLVWAGIAGNVVRINGDASAKDTSGRSRPLSAGSAVNEGDTISTAKESAIQIQMKDGALIAITNAAVLKVQAYKFAETNAVRDKIQLVLERGRLRTITGDGAKDTYSLSTPEAVIRIKGTAFDVLTDNGTTTILREGATTIETVCETQTATNTNIQLLDVPGAAAAISAPCKDPKSVEDDVDVSDLDAILPLPDERPSDKEFSGLPTTSGSASP